jgi:alpha-beta hydrolase superfamily lysophospholipase
MDGVLDDLEELARIAAKDAGDVPIVLFGHSMGALVAQAFVEQHGETLTAYVLSGTVGPMEGSDELAEGMRQAIDAGMADEPLDILGGLNAGFEPARTPFDWLSRDPDEVDRYIADPLCGDDLPLTYGFVAAMIATGARAMEPAGIADVPEHLNVLLLTGEADPVSNGATQARRLEQWLRDEELDVTAKYYPEARHEVLNETNRAEVHDDLVTWLEHVTRNTV